LPHFEVKNWTRLDFKTLVGQYLHTLLVAEMSHRWNTFLAQWKEKPKAFGKAYQMQFITYMQGAYPFTTPLTAGQTLLQWWMVFKGTEHGVILAVCPCQ